MAVASHPSSYALRLLLMTLEDLVPLQEAAKRENNAGKMKQCLDSVLDQCRSFLVYPIDALPEFPRLFPLFQSMEECLAMRTESETDKRAFIDQVDEILSRLRSEVKPPEPIQP